MAYRVDKIIRILPSASVKNTFTYCALLLMQREVVRGIEKARGLI